MLGLRRVSAIPVSHHQRKWWCSTNARIGDVVVAGIRSSSPHLIPQPQSFPALPVEMVGHLRWMAQKYNMGQDMFLCGHPGSLRRQIVMNFAAIAGLEVEYLAISRDTTENDLKQRREIQGSSVVFHDQAPVRAAIHGRLLVLDGIEYAERNVLPTLNNLLENREMALEDGRFLTRPSTIQMLKKPNDLLVAVHPQFRVVALGQCVPPYAGRTMDPPLRSRFQSRFVDELSSESLLELYSTSAPLVDPQKLSKLVGFYEALRMIRNSLVNEAGAGSLSGLPTFSLDSFEYCLNLLQKFPSFSAFDAVERCVPGISWMNLAIPPRIRSVLSAAVEKLSSGPFVSRQNYELKELPNAINTASPSGNRLVLLGSSETPTEVLQMATPHQKEVFDGLLPSQRTVLADMLIDNACARHFCILGPKGGGKSFVARAFGGLIGSKIRSFPLYQELTARDFLQRRVTVSSSAAGVGDEAVVQSTLPELNDRRDAGIDSGTSWVDSPLIAAARNGDICIMDGIDRVDHQVLLSMRNLFQDGVIDLPNGERLSLANGSIHPSFRVVALGLAPVKSKPEDARERFISSDLGFSYYQLDCPHATEIVSRLNEATMKKFEVDTQEHKSMFERAAEKVSRIVSGQTQLKKSNVNEILDRLDKAATECPELGLSLRQAFRLQRIVGSSREIEVANLADVLERMLLIRYVPSTVASRFYELVGMTSEEVAISKKIGMGVEDSGDILKIGNASHPKRKGSHPEKIPRPVFYDNAAHIRLLGELLHAVSVGEKSLLLIGNQGVGKNKLVDRLLELMHAEREYVQLHRDTTIQSLTLLPTLEDGQIRFEDSPMVRAARTGRALIVDEADKAPLEVVCLLKSLAEDGEVILYDGRRLLSHRRLIAEGGDPSNPPQDVVLIHPDFLLFVLANRPGFPFLGNNFFRECGDIFSTHIVDNLDMASEIELLRQYGPSVNKSILTRIASAFAALRDAHANSELSYPFSAREAVAVVKHIESFPDDGVAAAIEDILGFDSLSPVLRAQVAKTFQNHGLPVPVKPPGSIQLPPPVRLAPQWSLPPPSLVSLRTINEKTKRVAPATRAMSSREWTSLSKTRATYSLTSSRLLEFTEEICRLSLTGVTVDGQDASISYLGRVVSMIGDNQPSKPSCLHVLTIDPLVLHTFENVAEAVDFFRGREENIGASSASQTYHKRELLSEDMWWRLGGGSVRPLLLPRRSEGCYVLLPELSIVLSIGNPDDAVEMLTLPKQSIKNSTAVAGVFDKKKSTTRNGFDAMVSCDSDWLAMFQTGSSELLLLDFQAKSSHQLNLSPHLENITRVASLGVGNWLVNGDSGAFVLEVDRAGHSILKPVASSDWNVAAALKSSSQPNRGLLVSGDENFLARVRVQSAAEFSCWPRPKTDASIDLHTSALSRETIAQAVLEESSAIDPSIHLEVVEADMDAPKAVKIDISRPAAQIDARKSVVGIGILRNFRELSSGKITDPSSADSLVCVGHADGVIRIFETEEQALKQSQEVWQQLFGKNLDQNNWTVTPSSQRERDGIGKPRTGLGAPKQGKEDPENKPHVGGNTWAGGTGGSDTAGLGGRGGPYRLDKGHKVHQVSETLKKEISQKGREEAARIAKEGLQRRLEEISMGKRDYEVYMRYKTNVDAQISQLRSVLEELARRSKERVWLRHQTHGDLDDSKLVDGLTGDRLVFKRRGLPDSVLGHSIDSSSSNPHKKRLQFVVDVSGSMYRFNGQDRRLERMLESVLLVMESMPSAIANNEAGIIDYCITGHSGDSSEIKFLDFNCPKPANESDRFAVLESMVAHSQFCLPGDNTVRAISKAIDNILESTEGEENMDRYVFVVSDANFERYGISPRNLASQMTRDKRVQVHLILIASLGDEAEKLTKVLPSGRAHLCFETTSIPAVFRSILTSYGGALDI